MTIVDRVLTDRREVVMPAAKRKAFAKAGGRSFKGRSKNGRGKGRKLGSFERMMRGGSRG